MLILWNAERVNFPSKVQLVALGIVAAGHTVAPDDHKEIELEGAHEANKAAVEDNSKLQVVKHNIC